MFAKLAMTIVALGAFSCALLAMRQSRLQAASEIAQAQLRIQRMDDELLRVRSEIARRLAPHELEALTQGVGALKPIIVGEPLPTIVEPEAGEDEGKVDSSGKPVGKPTESVIKPPGTKKETKNKSTSSPRPTAIASVVGKAKE